MLRAYPKSFIKKFGRANIRAKVASMKTVNAALYFPYKHSSTMKWLAGCCPIGSVSEDMIGVGHGGSISNPVATAVSKTLKCVPFGMAVEMDKGFPIENKRVLLRINCVRPMKLLKFLYPAGGNGLSIVLEMFPRLKQGKIVGHRCI